MTTGFGKNRAANNKLNEPYYGLSNWEKKYIFISHYTFCPHKYSNTARITDLDFNISLCLSPFISFAMILHPLLSPFLLQSKGYANDAYGTVPIFLVSYCADSNRSSMYNNFHTCSIARYVFFSNRLVSCFSFHCSSSRNLQCSRVHLP